MTSNSEAQQHGMATTDIEQVPGTREFFGKIYEAAGQPLSPEQVGAIALSAGHIISAELSGPAQL